MKKSIYFLYAFLSFIFASCGGGDSSNKGNTDESIPQFQGDANNVDPLMIEIRDMEAKAKLDSVMDRNVGLRLLKAYQEYYNNHPSDSIGMHCLFEAARVADALGKYNKAVELLVNYHDGIPNMNKKAEAAYMAAFIYDAHLHNTQKATEYYNKVVDRYPNTTWAEQARSALLLVGKSDEELLRFLEEKNKKPA